MGREIKFRAWDKRHRCFDHNPIILNGKATILDSFDQLVETDQELQQFTGLRDKNDQEIYERDIARNKRGSVGVIEYHPSWGAFYFKLSAGRNEEGDLVEMIGSIPLWNEWGHIEVIGNILEHPHLLQPKEEA